MNHFDSTNGDLSKWNVSPSETLSEQASGAIFGSLDTVGSTPGYLYISYSASQIYTLTLPAANYPSGNDFHTNSILSFSYATKDSMGALAGLDVTMGSMVLNTPNLHPVGSPTKTSADWRSYSVSLNYLSNLGVNLNSFPDFSIKPGDNVVSNYLNAFTAPDSLRLAYGELAIDNVGFVTVPNPADSSASVQSTCKDITLYLGALSATPQGGATFRPAGYHIYRSASASGPWTSLVYTTSTATTYTDTSAINPTGYYKVLVYDTQAAGLNNTLLVASTGSDPASADLTTIWGANAGVNEALLSSATAIQASVQAPVLPVPPPTGALAQGCVSGILLSWTQASSGGCNNVQSYHIYRATYSPFSFTDSGATSVAVVNDPTSSYTDYSVSAGVPYTYAIVSIDVFGNISIQSNSATGQINTGKSCVAFTATVTMTATPGGSTGSTTPTPSATVTPTALGTFTYTPTAVVPPHPQAYFYPNPFHPDRAEKFRIKVDPSLQTATITIYSMVGTKVISFQASALSNGGGWDGRNQNGVMVVSGIYFVVVSGDSNVYRVGVVRD